MSNEEQERSATHTCANTKGMQFLLEFEDFVSKKPLDYFGEDMNFSMVCLNSKQYIGSNIGVKEHVKRSMEKFIEKI